MEMKTILLVASAQGWWVQWGRGDVYIWRRSMKGFIYGDGALLCLYFSGSYKNLYLGKNCTELWNHLCACVCTHTHTLKWVNVKNDKTWIKFVVQLPVLHKCQFSNFYIEQWSYRWHHLRTLSEGHLDFMYDLVSL